MNIIFGNDAAIETLKEKYIVLELDTIKVPEILEARIAYCVVDSSNLPVTELFGVDKKIELHEAMIRNYKKKDFKVVLDALKHLQGSFGGELDTFYATVRDRIQAGEVA